jgi:hypothetical protein
VNLQTQVEFSGSRRELIFALRKLRQGDFSVRLPEDGTESDLELSRTLVPGPTPDSFTILRVMFGSARKFWPRCCLGDNP